MPPEIPCHSTPGSFLCSFLSSKKYSNYPAVESAPIQYVHVAGKRKNSSDLLNIITSTIDKGATYILYIHVHIHVCVRVLPPGVHKNPLSNSSRTPRLSCSANRQRGTSLNRFRPQEWRRWTWRRAGLSQS